MTTRAKFLQLIQEQRGVPYQFGGQTGPVDCTDLIDSMHGRVMPRISSWSDPWEFEGGSGVLISELFGEEDGLG